MSVITEMSKLLVGLGRTSWGLTETFEVLDLESATTTCQTLPSFPNALEGSLGGLEFQNKAMICGGQDYIFTASNKCYSLEGNTWTSSSTMNTVLAYGAISPSPYPSKFQKLFVTGGPFSITGLNTAQILTEQGWETLLQVLPINISSHCSVLVNSTTVMVIITSTPKMKFGLKVLI